MLHSSPPKHPSFHHSPPSEPLRNRREVLLNDGKTSDPVDPLAGRSSFSLFPRSLTSNSNNSSSPTHLLTIPNSPNLNSLRTHLKSLAVRTADELVNQAKNILGDSYDFLKTDSTLTMGSKGSKESSIFLNEENPRAKRPGLGLERERAKFSMKTMPRQPDVCPEPSMDIDKLEDPDDYFAAFERMQDAKKELRKQRGEPLEVCDPNHASLAPRPRRPGLPGFRKPVTYEHRPYHSLPQEALRNEKLSATRENVLPETNFVNPLPRARVSDVSSAMNSKNSVLDELLSSNYDGLDEAGVQSFLLQKLDIKSIDISRPPFPKMPLPEIRDCVINSSSEAVPALHDSIFKARDTKKIAGEKPPDFRNLLRENSRNQQSPTFSKSPFASISSLKRKLSQLNSSMDPYSSLAIDSSPDIISYGKTLNGKQAKQSDTRDDIHGLVNVKDTTGFVISSPSSAGDIGGPSKESKVWLDEVSKGDQIVTNRDPPELRRSLGHEEENIAVPANYVDSTSASIEQEDQIVGAPKSVQQKMFNTSFAVEHSSTNGGGPDIREPFNAECIFDEALNEKMVRPFESNSKETEDSTVPSEGNVSVKIVNKRTAKSKAQSHVPGLEEPRKTRSYIKETEESAAPSEENLLEEIVNRKTGKAKSNAPVPEEPSKKKRKHCAVGMSKANDKQRRFSLFDAGTKLEAGVRRSSRIRMRPLEYWKGEKFLYGRVHNSLASVIGVKYASPTKDSKQPVFKVKSFVSDEYKDVVEFASY